ncbi:Tubulin/FtsZ family, GTPase domain containing protein [Acanthamoeba castellanii str. Neff]|uniref:Tubulin/FtsZ family, GTPase domain containing protein n=1 Tax=Acanthamoeba castellanii (strain ATCC 30010 / Neff) TaxID=1257118 RepID=L8H9R1_ACACF|nr:Tubulin/FtsZ family, GTPase domain containing protein [Acanthamoeba castellanii str. Neff]ELR21982.1 Tubulin/FtsZ family, GTPase domain containing protein [Acanthamoeba castellanii str. Neff]
MVAEEEEVPTKHALELLPAEVWWHVLQQLEPGPLADVVRLALVCRTFCALALGSETALEANPVASTAPPPFAPLRAAAIAHQWRLLSRQRWQQPVRNVGPLGPSPLIQISSGIIGEALLASYVEQVALEHDLLVPSAAATSGPGGLTLNHKIPPRALYGLGSHFRESDPGRSDQSVVARAVFADLEYLGMRTSKHPSSVLFDRSNCFHTTDNTLHGYWSQGHYLEGAESLDDVLDLVRREAERADTLQAFQLFHDVAGACGGGFTTLLLSRLREEYPDTMMSTLSVIPAPDMPLAVGPYNIVLTLHQLIEYADLCFYVSEKRARSLCGPSTKPIDLIARAFAGVTHPLRFPARQGNYAPSSLRSLAHTLVPYPRLHLLSLNHVPSWQPAAAMTPRALVDALYYYGNLLAPREQWVSGRLLASHAHFQLEPHTSSAGVVSNIEEPLAQMHDITTTVAAKGQGGEAEPPPTTTDRRDEVVVPWYVPWVADNAKHSFGRWHPRPSLSFGSREADVAGTTAATATTTGEQGSRLPRGSCTLVSNSTSVRHSLETSWEIFNVMFRRKAYLYYERGCDEMEYAEASSNVRDLADEYQEVAEYDSGS